MSQTSASQDQLLQLWASVAEVAGSVASAGREEAVDLELIEQPDALLPYLKAVLGDASVHGSDLLSALETNLLASHLVLSPLLRIRLLFAQNWFDAYLAQMNLDPEILDVACALRPPFLLRALLDDRLFVDRNNTFSSLLQLLSTQLPTWYSGQGRVGERFPGGLRSLLGSIGLEVNDAAGEAINTYLLSLDKEARRAKTNSARCVEREKSEAQIAACAAKVRLLHGAKVVGQSLPPFVDDFIRLQLLPELQFVLINHGEQHKVWLLWQRLLVLLAQVYTDTASQPQAQLYTRVQQAVSLLEPAQQMLSTAQPSYDDFVQTLLASLFSLLQGEAPEVVQVAKLDGADVEVETRAQVSRSLLRQVASVREGDWFLFEAEAGDIIRCQLVLKLIDVQKLFFVNRAGFKVLTKGVDEFALCLSSRVAVPLVVEPLFEASSVRAVNVLREIYDASLAGYREEQQRLDEARKERERLEEKDRQLRQQAAEKALKEAQLLAEQEQQRQKEIEHQRQQLQASERERLHAEAVKTVDELKVGSWLEMEKPSTGEVVRAKLAVAMPSTGKYIFVDRIGVKLVEYMRDELVELIESGRVVVVSKSDSFEDQLSKIVKGLRK